ncbi:MAG: suppressor of fused domain protein [Myxococcales bacterium]|nr:suppressor of fused domain protein [Myxococcales bacterium]MCB9575629.1 suppressor of fused domain protein [Polyangiaceae bacterium]
MNYCARIERHYAEQWKKPEARLDWVPGPRRDLPAGFAVLVFARTSEMRAFATRCMSQPGDSLRLELHMLCRVSEALRWQREFAELLAAVAHYHRTGATLDVGHTVNFGRPWLPNSTCEYGLLSLPYLDGPKLEWLAEPEVRFLWLLPVTKREVDFKRKMGLEALEQRFEESGLDFLDPTRESVC